MTTKKHGYFISVEGIEGVGKSTAMQFLSKLLKQKEIDCVVTREPGGTIIAEAIRKILLMTHEEKIHSDTELLLMFASRAQHVAEIIDPSLRAGKWVLCDRFTDASYAYQGGGRGIDKERIAMLEDWVLGSFRPNLTLLLDAPVEVGLQRIDKRTKDRIEQEQQQFFERVRQAYLQQAKENPNRYRIIDASKSITEVEKQLEKSIKELKSL